jgi:hypothetical protein
VSDGNDPVVVLRTAQYTEAMAVAAMLNDAEIPAETLGAHHNTMVLGGGGEAFAIRVAVPASREREAVALIEAYMHSIGAGPAADAEPEAPPQEEGLLACPNCERTGLTMRRPCPGCGFEVRVLENELIPVDDAKTFCPECRLPSTHASGDCADCRVELEPLESADRLCPKELHVLYRDTKGGAACPACKVVWADVG